MTEKLMHLIILGGSEWVMVLLIVLSIISFTFIIERAIYFGRRSAALRRIDSALRPLIRDNRFDQVQEVLNREHEPTLLEAVAGARNCHADRDAIDRKVASSLDRERLDYERWLGFLGTLGNNAPFIGLFGTVLGIIRAFRDLSMSGRHNTSVVMAGISEALVATAVGLFVALPAVLFYNYYQRRMDRALSITQSLAQGILATVPCASAAKDQADPSADSGRAKPSASRGPGVSPAAADKVS